jgi:type II secretion system protein J
MTRFGAFQRCGFTLMELLVATVIFSALIGSLYSLLFGALRLRETTFRNVESGQPREQISLLLRRDFTGAVAPSGVIAGPWLGESSEEDGNRRDTLVFYTTSGVINDREPWGDIQKVEYYLATPTDRDPAMGLDFIRKPTRNLLASTIEENEDMTPFRLLRGARSLQLLYWDGEAWIDRWDSTVEQNRNPRAVKLRLEFVESRDAERIESPIELVCGIAPEPRPTPAPAAAGGGAGGAARGGA